MSASLYEFLADDHDRLDALLERSVATHGLIEVAAYSEFRKGLLRHISIEEKIVFPAIARWQGGKTSALAERLHVDHGVIVSLLAPSPPVDPAHNQIHP
jgi:iron-sulfur cluster repair protein YtfE (RIC family)